MHNKVGGEGTEGRVKDKTNSVLRETFKERRSGEKRGRRREGEEEQSKLWSARPGEVTDEEWDSHKEVRSGETMS